MAKAKKVEHDDDADVDLEEKMTTEHDLHAQLNDASEQFLKGIRSFRRSDAIVSFLQKMTDEPEGVESPIISYTIRGEDGAVKVEIKPKTADEKEHFIYMHGAFDEDWWQAVSNIQGIADYMLKLRQDILEVSEDDE
jgi:hypothetical protein